MTPKSAPSALPGDLIAVTSVTHHSVFINRIGAMVIDNCPSDGSAARSEISLERSRFEIGARPFSCVAGSNPLEGLSLTYIYDRFSRKPKGPISLFWAR